MLGNQPLREALTFDDVLLLPAESPVLPRDVDVSTRLTTDIEKLIKKKLDLEPVELDTSRPRFEPREGRPDRGPRRGLDDGPAPAPRSYAPPRAPARDPLYDQPYEPAAADAEPAWDKKAVTPTGRVSPNIKPKRKVAALFASKKAD